MKIKKVLSGILAAAILLSSTSAATLVKAAERQAAGEGVEAGLVLHYDFNETSGAVALDKSGNGFDGELMGNVAHTRGFYDGAVKFSGDDTDYIRFPSEAFAGCEEITISMWIKLTADAGIRFRTFCPALLTVGEPGKGFELTANWADLSTSYYGEFSNGHLRYDISDGTKQEFVESEEPVGIDQWARWTNLTVTQADGTGKIYLDGELWAEGAVSVPLSSLAETGEARIGSNHVKYFENPGVNATTTNIKGEFEDFKIYDRAMTQDEIQKMIEPGTDKTFADLRQLIAANEDKTQADLDNAEGVWTAFSDALQQARTISSSASAAEISGAYGRLARAADRVRKIKVACVGDSITHGELSNNRKVFTKSYPAQLSALLGDEYDVCNFGVGSTTMLDREWVFSYRTTDAYQQSLEFNPDVVIIMLGTNDANTGYVIEDKPDLNSRYGQDACSLVETYLNLPSKPRVYIATSAYAYWGADNANLQNKIVPMQKAVAEKYGLTLIDINAATQDMGELFPDSTHPNRQGYSVIASTVCAALTTGQEVSQPVMELAAELAQAREIVHGGFKWHSEAGWTRLLDAVAQGEKLLTDAAALEDETLVQSCTEALSQANEVMIEEGIDSDISKLVYFVDCGDHNPETLSGLDRFGYLNSVTDQLYGEDKKSGYSWGVWKIDPNEVDTPGGGVYQDPNDKAAYTNYQKAFSNTASDLEDGKPKEVTIRYAHGQDYAGISPRYVAYQFELDPGVYDVEVGIGYPAGDGGEPIVTLSANGTDDVVSEPYANGNKIMRVDLTDAKTNEKGRVELLVKGTTDAATLQMTYITIREAELSPELARLIITPPTICTYEQDDALQTGGMVVKAEYRNGETRNLQPGEYTLSGFSSDTAGEKTVTVSYTENGVTKTGYFTVTVTERQTEDRPTGGGSSSEAQANKEALEHAVSAAVPEREKDKYTQASWEAYQAALERAQKVLADRFATQKEVDEAVEELEYALQQLKYAELPYVDVSKTDWFYDGVAFQYFANIMNGTSSTTFSPYAATTRAMIVTILYRQAGSPAVVSDQKTWWSDARAWGMESGVTDGTNMEQEITREQLATMLYRYAELMGMDVSERTSLDRFADGGKVSSYAVDALKWAVAEEIVTGKAGGVIDPQAGATRAETATMLMRFEQAQ